MGKAQRLNAAFDLLAGGYTPPDAAAALMEGFALSHRQAQRYVEQAQKIKRPVSVPSPIIPITIKIPSDVVAELRAYAGRSGLTIGETVARAVASFLARTRRRG
ncbi:MAG: hypothetical protein ACREFO_10475 [Acetobacteraceae bacterium]